MDIYFLWNYLVFGGSGVPGCATGDDGRGGWQREKHWRTGSSVDDPCRHLPQPYPCHSGGPICGFGTVWSVSSGKVCITDEIVYGAIQDKMYFIA